jgi:hypothetical protein
MFKPGQSGNPGGMPKGTRDLRNKVREALDAAFTEDGRDLLVDAIKAGVQTGDSTCLKLAADYRWGKPVTQIELSGPDGEPIGNKLDLSRLSAEEFASFRAAVEKAKGETE